MLDSCYFCAIFYQARICYNQTEFVFIKEDYDEVDVPVWAIKYILVKSEFEEERHEY